jgi:hypothetical protein
VKLSDEARNSDRRLNSVLEELFAARSGLTAGPLVVIILDRLRT